MLITKREDAGLKHCNDSKAFIEYSNDMNDIYEKIEEYNPKKERKILIVFDDMVTDMLSNKKLNPVLLFLLHNLILLYQKILGSVRILRNNFFPDF